jgi:hypothetical protein
MLSINPDLRPNTSEPTQHPIPEDPTGGEVDKAEILIIEKEVRILKEAIVRVQVET